MSNKNANITPIGLLTALLIIGLLAALAIPRFRWASREERPSSPPRVLATFGASGEVGAGTEVGGNGVTVICKACEN